MNTTNKLAEALRLGQEGAPATENERLLFEEWMRGHCWALCATWNGKQYVSDAERDGLGVDPRAMNTRQLFAAWRDRAALAAYEAEAEAKAGTAEPVAVPAEPTLEMLKAGAAEWLKYGEREACYPLAQGFDKLTPEDAIRRSRLTHVYRAMLAAAPAAPAMPNPGSPEASAMIDSVLAEYNWPSNTKNAARAGYVAATRLMAAPAAPATHPDTKDAARYRWLRDPKRIPKNGNDTDGDGDGHILVCDHSGEDVLWLSPLDRAIDAAIAASIGKGGAA